MADFETTVLSDDCRVWAWGLANIDTADGLSDVEDGKEIESFIGRIAQHNSVVYFHNLKFDGWFIIDWLLRHDYWHTQVNDGFGIAPWTFKTLISDKGMFYSITVRWRNGTNTEFRDSYKKVPFSVATVGKEWNLGPELTKGELDYLKDRPIGYEMSEDERDYLRRDVLIMALAMREISNQGMSKLTVGADSLAEFKSIIGKENFSKLFPVLSDEMDREIRRAYRGGFTYADPRFTKRITGPGITLDVNSLYPHIMVDRLIPYGEPVFIDGQVPLTKARPLSIFSVTFTAKLRKEHIPCIQVKGSSRFHETEYLREITEPVTLMVTNVDWALYREHYDIRVIEYNGGWSFKAAQGLFDQFIDKYMEIKAVATGSRRQIAKLILNALYGKFATNPNVTGKIPILEDNRVRLVRGPEEIRPPVYTAAGVFITSWARDLTIRAAQDNYATFAYADTDSLHLLQTEIPQTIDVHPTKLGAWKLELEFDAAFYIRPKAYLERHALYCTCKECEKAPDGERVWGNAIAGMPTAVTGALTFDDLVDGKILHGKLNPKSVPGGVILKDVPFELKI